VAAFEVIAIDEVTERADFDLWGFVDVYPWECDACGVDLRYMLTYADLESSDLKHRIIRHFGLTGEDAEQVSERIRATVSIALQADATGRHLMARRNPVAFYDRYADGGRDDYFVKGLDVSDEWFESHVVSRLRECLWKQGGGWGQWQ